MLGERERRGPRTRRSRAGTPERRETNALSHMSISQPPRRSSRIHSRVDAALFLFLPVTGGCGARGGLGREGRRRTERERLEDDDEKEGEGEGEEGLLAAAAARSPPHCDASGNAATVTIAERGRRCRRGVLDGARRWEESASAESRREPTARGLVARGRGVGRLVRPAKPSRPSLGFNFCYQAYYCSPAHSPWPIYIGKHRWYARSTPRRARPQCARPLRPPDHGPARRSPTAPAPQYSETNSICQFVI